MNFTQLDLNRLEEIFLVANTPSYLYRHLRAEPSLERFAGQHTVDELVQFVASVAQNSARTLRDVVLAYAVAVFLSFNDSPDLEAKLQSLIGSVGLEWLAALLEILRAKRVATQISSPPRKYIDENARPIQSAAASSRLIIVNGSQS